MNVEMLRKEYDKLTPFERAAMIMRESVGLKRDSEIEALHTSTLFDALWTTAWNSNFFHVAAFAAFKAVCAEKFSLLHLAFTEERPGFDDPAPDNMLEAQHVAVGWLRALRRLGEETGAPFMDSIKILDPFYAERLLAAFEDEDIDDSQQYAFLLEVWKAVTTHVNAEDQYRLVEFGTPLKGNRYEEAVATFGNSDREAKA